MKVVGVIRLFFQILFVISVLLLNACSSLDNAKEKKLTFAAIADCQYCAVESRGVRKYALSKEKLSKCVIHLNSMELEFVIHLGDFIDRDFRSFDVVIPIYKKLKFPKYHVLGNHEFDVKDEYKEDVPKKLGLKSKYYDFKHGKWRFIVLDGNDISFHAYPKNSSSYKASKDYYETNNPKSPKWNGAVGSKQLSWLKSILDKSIKNAEKVIIFCHFPVYPKNSHNLWNAQEMIDLIEPYTCVKAYFSGHNHKGNYAQKKGIHYITLKGMVDTNETSYAVIDIDHEKIVIKGHGREENRELLIR